MLLATPNFAEGRNEPAIERIAAAFAEGVEVLDLHSDRVHNRSVVTLAGRPGDLGRALERGAAACLEEIDLETHEGAHPTVGALDVCPVIWLAEGEREAARAEALTTSIAIGALGIPVFFYGELAPDAQRRERAFFRRGGLAELTERMRSAELKPDFGPPQPHPTAGATLITARPPLAAFNLVLDTSEVEVAREVAANLREAGDGLVGVRALGIDFAGRAQVSTNIHDPVSVPLAAVIARVAELAAERGARPVSGEVVGLVPEAALRDLPDDPPLEGFDPAMHVIERRVE